MSCPNCSGELEKTPNDSGYQCKNCRDTFVTTSLCGITVLVSTRRVLITAEEAQRALYNNPSKLKIIGSVKVPSFPIDDGEYSSEVL